MLGLLQPSRHEERLTRSTAYLATEFFPLPLQELHSFPQDGDVLGAEVDGQGVPQQHQLCQVISPPPGRVLQFLC